MIVPSYPFNLLLALLAAQAAQGKTFPFCEGKYFPTNATCAMFQFSPKQASPSSGSGCSILPPGASPFPDITSFPPPPPLTPKQKHLAETLTNIFENGEEAFGYAAVEDLGDGRGYTAGRVGFTTGTGDALELIELYNRTSTTTQAKALTRYLPELRHLSSLNRCDTGRASTSQLHGFDKAWKVAALKDPAFPKAQDTLNDQMYMTPGRRFAATLNVTSPLGQALFYDTIIQHGWQLTEPDINIQRIIALTGERKENECESTYLTRFLHTRRSLLCCYPDTTWPDAADRISDLQGVLENKDLQMVKTIHLESYKKDLEGLGNEYY